MLTINTITSGATINATSHRIAGAISTLARLPFFIQSPGLPSPPDRKDDCLLRRIAKFKIVTDLIAPVSKYILRKRFYFVGVSDKRHPEMVTLEIIPGTDELGMKPGF